MDPLESIASSLRGIDTTLGHIQRALEDIGGNLDVGNDVDGLTAMFEKKMDELTDGLIEVLRPEEVGDGQVPARQEPT